MNSNEIPFSPGSSVVAYLRDSGGQAQDLSVPQQEKAAREFCEKNHLTLTRIFADAAQSGGSVVGRVQFDSLMAFFETAPAVAGVIFYSYSRLSRNYNDAQYSLATIRRAGYKIYSLDDPVPEGSVGRIIETLYLWEADEFRQRLSRVVKRGQRHVIEEFHAYVHPQVPPGYKKTPVEIGTRRGKPHVVNRLEIDLEVAPVVREIFAMRAAGLSIREIHEKFKLYKSGNGYKNMLKNSIYRGIYSHGDYYVEGFCDPIIDNSTWYAVQEINKNWKDRFKQYSPRAATSDYLLSGLIVCGLCGGAAAGKSSDHKKRGKKYRYYRCIRAGSVATLCPAYSITAEQLENRVMNVITDRLFDPSFLAEVYDRVKEKDSDGSKVQQLRAKEQELADTGKGIINLSDAIAKTGGSAVLLDALTDHEAQQKKIRQEIEELEARIEADHFEIPEDLAVFADEMKRAIEAADFRQKQLLVRAVVQEVKASRTKRSKAIKGEISLRIPGTDVVEIMPL